MTIRLNLRKWALLAFGCANLCTMHVGYAASEAPMSFGVITQRSAVQTAQYWNPILHYVSRVSGVPLQIKLAKTGSDHASMIRRGEFDFLYSNHNFTAENDVVGYSVFARPLSAGLHGQLITSTTSGLRSITDLQDKPVAFPSTVAFVGYQVPMDALRRAGIRIQPQFASTQEGALEQLASGKVPAAGVNAEIAKNFYRQHKFEYRVLWSSEEYLSIPISAHPSVPKSKRDAVRSALLNMAQNPEGLHILKQSAALVGDGPPYGFAAASDQDYDNMRRLYKNKLAASQP